MTEKDKICYIRPKRALRRLKAAEEENITAYIYGVSGIGKTELIVRYLKQKKYQMFDAGRVSAEELEGIAESEKRKIVVIDNLHDLAMEEECEDCLLYTSQYIPWDYLGVFFPCALHRD